MLFVQAHSVPSLTRFFSLPNRAGIIVKWGSGPCHFRVDGTLSLPLSHSILTPTLGGRQDKYHVFLLERMKHQGLEGLKNCPWQKVASEPWKPGPLTSATSVLPPQTHCFGKEMNCFLWLNTHEKVGYLSTSQAILRVNKVARGMACNQVSSHTWMNTTELKWFSGEIFEIFDQSES